MCGAISGVGPFETCRRTVTTSVYRGRAEVVGSGHFKLQRRSRLLTSKHLLQSSGNRKFQTLICRNTFACEQFIDVRVQDPEINKLMPCLVHRSIGRQKGCLILGHSSLGLPRA